MVATVILGMLCVHLFCFCVMFLLISRRLQGRKMGTEAFALGNLLLGLAYALQLLGGPAGGGVVGIANHTLTLCAPVAYLLGAMRFFDRPVALARPLLLLAIGYSCAQLLVQALWGAEARPALLAACCALLFLGMVLALLQGARSFARELRMEMLALALLIGGIGVLNAIKCAAILSHGLQALDMGGRFQTVFYIYMSFLGTVLPPAVVWLVLRRLADELQALAVRDPLTGVLNRRGLLDGLGAHFRSRSAGSAHVLMVDIDHFKAINDSHGHVLGDKVLCQVAGLLERTARQGDLVCRLGGEEFVVVALESDAAGAWQLAERLRMAVADGGVDGPGVSRIRCTATIGVSQAFATLDALNEVIQQADAALYRGKQAGRNRVEL